MVEFAGYSLMSMILLVLKVKFLSLFYKIPFLSPTGLFLSNLLSCFLSFLLRIELENKVEDIVLIQ